MESLADQQDDCDNYFEFYQFCGAYFHIGDKAGQFEAAFFDVLVPQIDCQTWHWYYLVHWQVVVQAFIKFSYDSDVFWELFICWKLVYLFFEGVQHQVDDEENDENEHQPEDISHVADEREVLVSDHWKWRSLKFFSVDARFQAQKIVSEDLEEAIH